jgi:hypothetical protein
MTLQVGDIVTLNGYRRDVYFVFSGLDIQKYQRVPAGDWGRFTCCNEAGWDIQVLPMASATFVARPDVSVGKQVVWNSHDGEVTGIKYDQVYLKWEGSYCPVPIVDLVVNNASMFLPMQESTNQ